MAGSYKAEGKKGEGLALDYLKSAGYKILAVNARAGMHEVDIVCEDDFYCVFIEVKTTGIPASGDGLSGRPSARVDRGKRNHLIKGVGRYIKEKGVSLTPRIDVIEIYYNCPPGGLNAPDEEDVKHIALENGVQLVHIRNAVTADMRTWKKPHR